MDEISHTGRIVSIDKYVTEVEIIRHSACGECHARALCGYSSDEKKIVPVPTDAFAMRKVGDEVELCMKKSMGTKAVLISYVFPLIVLLLTLLITKSCGMGELWSGLSAIASVVVYYVVTFFFRDKLKNQFEFYIKD